jgi:hypothetical protein
MKAACLIWRIRSDWCPQHPFSVIHRSPANQFTNIAAVSGFRSTDGPQFPLSNHRKARVRYEPHFHKHFQTMFVSVASPPPFPHEFETKPEFRSQFKTNNAPGCRLWKTVLQLSVYWSLAVLLIPGCRTDPWLSYWSLAVLLIPGCRTDPWLSYWSLAVLLIPGCLTDPWLSYWSLAVILIPGCHTDPWLSYWSLAVVLIPGCRTIK